MDVIAERLGSAAGTSNSRPAGHLIEPQGGFKGLKSLTNMRRGRDGVPVASNPGSDIAKGEATDGRPCAAPRHA